MLRRLLSVVLILTLLCVDGFAFFPAAAETETDDIYGNSDTTLDSGYPTFSLGDRDGDDSTAYIVMMQNRLIELNYLSDAADGVYGKNTESAVSAFQASNGLQATGIADAATQTALYADTAVAAPVSMDSQNVIYRVQQMLSTWGFLADKADGVAGDATSEAVSAFKSYMKAYYIANPTPSPEPTATAEPTPFVGFEDAPEVMDVPLDTSAPDGEITEELLAYADGEIPFETFTKSVAGGDSGDEVLRVQRRLKALKYLYYTDGEFGSTTERALLYFQKKSGLDQNGVADEATQRLLFSADAPESEEYVFGYKVVVDLSEQRVYAYQWNGSSYGTCVREMICSTGKSGTPTPQGIYQAGGPSGSGEWYYFKKYKCYAKYGYFIVGGIMFHSVIYSMSKKLKTGTVSDLGHKASHGCIRLKVEDAKWIYENCPSGTTIVIQP